MEISQEERKNLDSSSKENNIMPTDDENNQKNTKTEGVANDISNSLEPLLRAGEKLFDLDRRAVGTWIIKGALKGNLGGVEGLFGKQKRTRLEKFKEAIEIAIWIAILLMAFFWLNYGVARWMGVL